MTETEKIIQIIPSQDRVAVFESGKEEDIVCFALVYKKEKDDDEGFESIWPMYWSDVTGLTSCYDAPGFLNIRKAEDKKYG